MKKFQIALIAASVSVISATVPVQAGLGEAGELEHARANARAGGPISARDAELLERYGCLSGTRSSFCQQLDHRSSYRQRPRPNRNYRY